MLLSYVNIGLIYILSLYGDCENFAQLPLSIIFRLNESLSKTIDELKVEIEKLKGSLQEEINAKESAVNEASQTNFLSVQGHQS